MYYDPYGLFGIDDIFGVVYDVTGGWSPSQGLVNGAAGFGDGAYAAITLGIGDLQDVRDILDIDGGVDPCSDAYRGFKVAGTLVGAGALGGAVGSKSFAPGGWLNSNRYFRVGFGRRGGRETFRMAGQWLERLTGKSKKDLWTGGPL